MDTYIKYDLPDYRLKYKISVTLRVSSPVCLSVWDPNWMHALFHYCFTLLWIPDYLFLPVYLRLSQHQMTIVGVFILFIKNN